MHSIESSWIDYAGVQMLSAGAYCTITILTTIYCCIFMTVDHKIPRRLYWLQCNELKLIDRLRATRWTSPDYWQTDNSNGLVMVIRNYHWLNSASRVLEISTCSAPQVQTGDRKHFLLFDLDLWPTTLTYNPRLAKVKIDPHTTNHGQRSNDSNRRAPTLQTNGRTHTRTLPNVLSPLLCGR